MFFLLLPVVITAQETPFELRDAFPFLRTSFNELTDIQNAGDGSGRLFIAVRVGRIFVLEAKQVVTGAPFFLDINDKVTTDGYENGLLGFAFHPNYAENGYLYVHYTYRDEDRFYTRISRFTVSRDDPNQVDRSSELPLFDFQQPAVHHNGGQLAFGPDGYLYIGLGDGMDPDDPLNSGQDLRSILGKILRVDVDNPANGKNYGIPASNPFAGNTEYAQEIYAWGLRNPWRFSFDPLTGNLWAGDVGQHSWEEINLIQKGGNYGWRVMEGYQCHRPENDCDSIGLIGPVWTYGHHGGLASVSGGYVYRGSELPELEGKYIYGGYVSGNIWTLDYNDTEDVTNTLLIDTDLRIATFGVDEENELYVGGFANGRLYKLVSIPEEAQKSQEVAATLSPITSTSDSSQLKISWHISRTAPVSLSLFNLKDGEAMALVDQTQKAGDHHLAIDVEELPAGHYSVQLNAGKTEIARTFTLSH